MTEVIPVYQAGFFLEEAGYLLQKSQEGCLTPWFMQTKEAALEERRDNKLDLFSRVTKVNAQRAFWVKNFETIFETEGLFSRDKKRLFDKLDKIRAWNRQEGRCAECGKPVKANEVGHHVILWTTGGKSTPDNCSLVHRDCHAQIHSGARSPVNQARLNLFSE